MLKNRDFFDNFRKVSERKIEFLSFQKNKIPYFPNYRAVGMSENLGVPVIRWA